MEISNPLGNQKFKQVVREIMNVERQPIRQLEARKAKENERLKLIQEFLGKVRKLPDVYKELDNFRKFRELKAEWPAKDLIDVTVDKDVAEPGDYQIEVTQLAGRHSMISNGYESPNDEIGVGYFTYDLPNGDTKSVWLGPGDNTLRGLVSKINDQKGLGIQASLVNDGSDSGTPWRIVVHGKKSGMDNDLIFPDFYFLDGDFRFAVDDERDAQNAIVKFNGFEIMSQSNKFELLQGVTVDLKQAKEDYEFTLAISEDVAKISGKVKALVDSINEVLNFVIQQNKLDADSDTSKTLGGDTTLLTVQSRVQTWIFEYFNVDPEDEEAFMRLGDVGVSFQKTGLLSFEETKFKKALEENFEGVAALFAGEGNFIDRIKELTSSLLAPGTGVVGSREAGIKSRIKEIDRTIINREMALSRREDQLKRQFSQLEGLSSSMQSQQAYLAQALGGGGILPGMG